MRACSVILLMSLAAACAPAAAPIVTPRADTAPDRAARVVASLVPMVAVRGAPPVRYRLEDRMKRYAVPGVSIAVADGGRVAWARGFGVRASDGADAVTPSTMFQAGSISKPVTATATLRLVERGALSLDDDVNAHLKAWKVPESDLTKTEKVTLRRILSHSAGLSVHGFPGYAAGAPLPTIVQVLDGETPANTAPVRVVAVPGSTIRYSGGGVMIEQLALTEAAGAPFPALMKSLVLDPIGMRDSTFEQPLAPAASARAVSAHDMDGRVIPGRANVYPEMAAAGLWSTPTDLLRWAIAIADARAGSRPVVLSQASARAMLTPQGGPVGLGPFVHGEGRAFRFGHPGTDEGFHAELVYFPETGQGAAVMVNGNGGRPMLREILYAIGAEYGWPDFAPDVVDPIAIDAAAEDRVVGTFETTWEAFFVRAVVTRKEGALIFDCPRLGLRTELLFASSKELIAKDTGDPLAIDYGADGRASALRFGDIALRRRD